MIYHQRTWWNIERDGSKSRAQKIIDVGYLLVSVYSISRNPPISWYQKPKMCLTIHSNVAPFLFCSTDSAAMAVIANKTKRRRGVNDIP